MNRRRISLILALTIGLYLHDVPTAIGQTGSDDSGGSTALDATEIAGRLTEAQAKLEGFPKTAAPGSSDALQAAAWKRRVELLARAAELLTQSADQDNVPNQIQERQRLLAERRAAPGSGTTLESPTEAGLAALEGKVADQRQRVTVLQGHDTAKTLAAEKVPTALEEFRATLQAAVDLASRLEGEASATTDPTQKELLAVRADNASLAADVARLEARVLEKRREQEKLLAPLRVAEMELAAARLSQFEQELTRYTAELGQAIDREAVQLEAEITQLEATLAAATGPTDQFVAQKNLEIARIEKNKLVHGRFLLALRADSEEQKRRLKSEKEELSSLRSYIEKAGAGQQAGERIKFTMQRVKHRRHALERTLDRDITGELSEQRSRRLELENGLFLLKESWDREVEKRTEPLSDAETATLKAAATQRFEPYRAALFAERDLLNDVIGAGQALQVALIERGATLDEIEAFIRSKVFWIRDAKPLGTEIWPRLVNETMVVTAWAQALRSPEALDRLKENIKQPKVVATVVFLLLFLPIGLFWTRQRLRQIVKRLNDRTVADDARAIDRVFALATSIVSVALLPGYLLIASQLTHLLDLPATLAPVVSSSLVHMAIFLFGLFVSSSFFAGRGTAQVQFGMDGDAAHALHRSLRLALIAYLGLFATASILSHPPFFQTSLPLEALPRIAYTLFLVVAVLAAVLLLRPRSTFSRYWSTALGDNFFGRRWPFFGAVICLAGIGTIVLEVAGYRYGAGVLAKNLIGSLALVLLLVPLYKGIVATVASVARRRRENRETSEPDPEASGSDNEIPQSVESEIDEDLSFAKFLRVFFLLGGAVLIASMWGIDEQTFSALDLLKAYDIRDTGDFDDFVSWGHVLRSVLYIAGTYLLLKYLPGIYEYAIFPRLKLDAGLKYAILTMSRYGVFTVGIFVALSAIKLDLGRLQWLMAAIGVGLGFGLQEIVSNFVSGIIILVERPVRVGDIVTVGTTSGKVQRINIRATTVVNFDRQEIIVPNRSLITKEVTNWTRGDTILRLVVPIGVAYGSDVDQVTDLLLEIARDQKDILRDPAPQALFLNHGASSLDFELRVFVPNPSMKNPLLHALNRTINRRLAELDIEIPFPQQDLHLRSSSIPWPKSEA